MLSDYKALEGESENLSDYLFEIPVPDGQLLEEN